MSAGLRAFDEVLDRVLDVACGIGFSLALTENNQVVSWGVNAQALGRVVSTQSSCVPRPIKEFGTSIKQIACCMEICVALTLEGQVYVWGNFGRFSEMKPILVEALSDVQIVKAACTVSRVLLHSSLGDVFQWVRSNDTAAVYFTQIKEIESSVIIDIACGYVKTKKKKKKIPLHHLFFSFLLFLQIESFINVK